jgi:hypothetical protein
MPKVTNEPLKYIIPPRLNEENYQDLLTHCKYQKIKLSAFVRRLILHYFSSSN